MVNTISDANEPSVVHNDWPREVSLDPERADLCPETPGTALPTLSDDHERAGELSTELHTCARPLTSTTATNSCPLQLSYGTGPAMQAVSPECTNDC